MPSLHTAATQAEMEATFPPPCQHITGEPSLMGLLTIYTHTIQCAQTFVTEYHHLNYLFIAVPRELWNRYSATAYPEPPPNPGDSPVYTGTGDNANAQNQTVSYTHLTLPTKA